MRPVYPRIPLKDMESGLLVMELHRSIQTLYGPRSDEQDMVFAAAQVATHLHRDQTRSTRRGLPSTPYIEHPLRNTLRTMRWGFEDPVLLAGCLLHDVPEDCSAEIVKHFAVEGRALAAKEEGQPDVEVALLWVGDGFGEEVEAMTRALTNGPAEEGLTRAERNADYVEHALEGARADQRNLVGKAADVFDNGGSLRHQFEEGSLRSARTMLARLDKYEPLVEGLAEIAKDPTERVGVRQLYSRRELDDLGQSLDRLTGHFEELRPRAERSVRLLTTEPVRAAKGYRALPPRADAPGPAREDPQPQVSP